MITESFDQRELQAIRAALEGIQARCDSILGLGQTEAAQQLYAQLKADLREARKYLTLDGRRRELTRAETVFYQGAIRNTLHALTPPTNISPANPKFATALRRARSVAVDGLHKLAPHLPGA